MSKGIEEFTKPSFIHESLFCGYLWATPSLFQKYKTHKITRETFTEDVWYFYFGLGQQMYENGIREYDDKTVYSFVVSRPKEVGKPSYIDTYNKFGAFATIKELMDECSKEINNDEYHLNEIQKYETLRKFEKEFLVVEYLKKCNIGEFSEKISIVPAYFRDIF